MNLREKTSVAVGHIDDPASIAALCKTLYAIHGPEYSFSVTRWQGQTTLTAPRGRQRFCFVMEEEKVRVILARGQRMRGVPASGPYQRLEEHWVEVIAPVEEEIWPGDVLCVDGNQRHPIIVTGNATCFQVETEATVYPLPAVAFLRHLNDHPGGCAAYPGAFRREALPPVRAAAGAEDQRGVNRVNEHTLDMRIDRTPHPQPHHHGPVAIGVGSTVSHSETALVLPRDRYNLPPVAEPETGRVIIYPQAASDPADRVIVPVQPGSVVVTPATTEGIVGHCFENAFAMLVAIPGFVSPHHSIEGSY